jgi:flagellar protein FlgJ
VRDYASLLGTNSRYASVRNTGSDITAFAAGLQRAGYATDPDYAKKLTAVAAQLGLASCASAALKQSTPVPTTSLTGSVSSRS